MAVAGCGGEPEPAPEANVPSAATPQAAKPRAAQPSVRRARCPAAAANCAAVTGRVLYVEAVDPDGDGDAHYVLAGGDVTGPGLSVIDVGPALRPRRLPRAGELVSAAGPVFAGSHGQRQIEARVVHHQRSAVARGGVSACSTQGSWTAPACTARVRSRTRTFLRWQRRTTGASSPSIVRCPSPLCTVPRGTI